LHPRLRTAWLVNEFLQQTDRTVEVRIGSRVPPQTIRNAVSDRAAADYLRWRTYVLSGRARPSPRALPILQAVLPRKTQDAVAPAVPGERLQQNLANLNPAQLLFQNQEFSVYQAEAREIPDLLQEVGRLREVTFRAVGEGTGRSIDLDQFDHYYTHVLLWSKSNRELVGGYRVGRTSEILPRLGIAGLYTSTLFRYDARLFAKTGPALELGRSFIRPEYQRLYAPLLTLWKGIGRYLVARPQTPVLFGAVSISNSYCRCSRELMVRFFRPEKSEGGFDRLLSPRRPFRPRWTRPEVNPSRGGGVQDLEQLADLVTDLEMDGKSVPILLKHYAKLGGQFLSFNVDKDFSDTLDGLVLVDLRQSDPTVLQRYLGEDGLQAFQSYHGVRPTVRPQ